MKKKSQLIIVNDADDFGPCNPESDNDVDEARDFQENDHDEYLPVIVNAHEFTSGLFNNVLCMQNRMQGQFLNAPHRPEELPSKFGARNDKPRVQTDNVVYRDKSGKRITRQEWLVLNQVISGVLIACTETAQGHSTSAAGKFDISLKFAATGMGKGIGSNSKSPRLDQTRARNCRPASKSVGTWRAMALQLRH
ncbi:hypothetical protein BdWA1_000802 [Babesia duncani]|uniref:Uncharacterized protein n=1 Tax=Babesia duncani TaxID=323732 RepID=A0AAD9UQC7_9APIC|nr:hypothetical protein BdWA1_000802 [Babesia duncani]